MITEQRACENSRVVVLIPCYNEEKTIGQVVRSFRSQLPDVEIYVFDNDSTDLTVEEATRAGANVRYEKRRGKGHVLRSMFREVNADIYVMVDGDGTYPHERVHDLIEPILTGRADMVIGSRLHASSESHFKTPNRIGNWAFRVILNLLFRERITDLLSGYRAMNKQVVKSIPFLSRGFESETELTVKCLERGFRVIEVPVNLGTRPEGSQSKIHIVRDGILILETLFALARDYKPLTIFAFLGLFLIGGGLIPGSIVVQEYFATGQILRLPLAILAVGLVLSGLLATFAGIILHTIARRFEELDYQIQKLLGQHFSGGHFNESGQKSKDA